MSSAQQQQQSGNAHATTSKNVCVITNADSLLGYALCFRFLEAMRNREDPETEGHKLRILCRETHGLGLKRLEEMGAEICEINYKDEEKIRHAMKNVRYVMLIPENSSDRVKEAENLIKAAKHQDVEHLSLMSCMGVGHIQKSMDNNDQELNSSEFCNLKEFCHIEKKVKETFSGNKHCIVRHQMFNQLFYFLAPQIEGENVLALPVKKSSKWGTVNMNESIEGVYRLACKQRQEQRNNPNAAAKKNVWEFTSSCTYNGDAMAREVGEGLGRQDLHYKEVSEDDFKKILERMKQDKRFKERPDTDNKFGEGRDGWWSFPLGKFLNEHCIETEMEYLRLACKGHLDVTCDDLKHVLNRQPQTLKDYFKVNRDQFKRFK